MEDPSPLRAPLESLASELHIQILNNLTRSDIARLLRCSKTLHFLLHRHLWEPPGNAYIALYWGCKKGHVSTIRQAVNYGARPDVVAHRTVRMYHGYDPVSRGRPARPRSAANVPISTLHITAKHRHAEAFAALLEMGVPLRGPDRILVRHVCASLKFGDSPDSLLRVFMREMERQHLKLPATGPPSRGQFLGVSVSELFVRFIQAQAPLDILRSLLDDWDADPHRAQLAGKPYGQLYRLERLTPLAAAILAGNTAAFELLIARGVDVNFGTGSAREYDRVEHALEIPILAAAYAMARSPSGRGMMERLLALGADINPPVSVRSMQYQAMVDWAARDDGLDPAGAYRFLHSRGARPDPGAGVSVLNVVWRYGNGSLGNAMGVGGGWWAAKGAHSASNDARVRAFAQVVLEEVATMEEREKLVEENARPRQLGGDAICENFTARLHGYLPLMGQSMDMRRMEDLLAMRLVMPREAAASLHHILMGMGSEWWRLWEDRDGNPAAQCFLVDWYLSCGADINAVPENGVDEEPLEPPLWVVCKAVNEFANDWYWSQEKSNAQEGIREFMRFLMLKGADPYFRISGKNAFDLLISDPEEPERAVHPKHKATRKAFLDRVAEVMRGGGQMNSLVLCPACEGHLVDKKFPHSRLKRSTAVYNEYYY